ncbi:TetR/AcrR family transcriptional regulator [Gynuella sunshinyii]|uniref:Transcriptional regulator n=1 Tax=Gynuella sunshinyii YC6258 TaxID=1445510 RepID=A0A0C5V0K0_9GAMM|nr:TetR/AcrR family transcriptional regulator [Gynuella sunshinyii]AJQ93090.1 transcriptional regulator [Gynuella sunshinyii YC6258]
MYQETIDKRVIRTRLKLFDALQQLLEHKPLHAISVIEVTKIAKIGRASFYRHFNNLEDILKWRLEYEDKAMSYEFLAAQNQPFADLTLFFLRSWMQRSSLLACLIKANRMDILEELLCKDQKALEFVFEGRITDPRIPYRPQASSHSILADNRATGYITVMLSGLLSSILVKWVTEGKKETPEELSHIATTTISTLAKRLNNQA